MTRQEKGYLAVVSATTVLIASYSLLIWLYPSSDLQQTITSALLTLAPLLLFVRRAWLAERRAFAALALLAPLYLLYGGIIWLWSHPWIGAWLCWWAITLEVGAILHNYQKRDKTKRRQTKR